MNRRDFIKYIGIGLTLPLISSNSYASTKNSKLSIDDYPVPKTCEELKYGMEYFVKPSHTVEITTTNPEGIAHTVYSVHTFNTIFPEAVCCKALWESFVEQYKNIPNISTAKLYWRSEPEFLSYTYTEFSTDVLMSISKEDIGKTISKVRHRYSISGLESQFGKYTKKEAESSILI